MNHTIDLPETLTQELEQYLKLHPEQTLNNLIQEALAEKIVRKTPSKLLTLAGIVTESANSASEYAEDSLDLIKPC